MISSGHRSGGDRQPQRAAQARIASAALAGFLSLAAGCRMVGPTPMAALRYPVAEDRDRAVLLVLLQGRLGSHKFFERQGYVETAKRKRVAVDIVVPAAHYGYYAARNLEERLHEDIIEPARRAGYRRIWLVGFSMGGLGSLLYNRQYTQDVSGIVLMSPYLGSRGIVREITQAGGLRSWQPGRAYDPERDWERMLWASLKRYADDPAALPPLFLASGTNDMYAAGHRLLAGVLPSERVIAIPGGHTFRTFKDLWDRVLDRVEFENPGRTRPQPSP